MRAHASCVYNYYVNNTELLEATYMVKKYVLPCLLGLMSVFCLSSLTTTSLKKHTTSPAPLNESRLLNVKEAAHDYTSEVEIPDGNLMVSATSSTQTSMGQSFSLTFSTGGQGWCDATTSFLLAPDDADFDTYFKELSEKTVEEREEITEAYERGEYEPVHFSSYVYSLSGTASVHDIVIPRSLTRNHIFNLDVTRLGVDVVRDWTNINSITIPSDVSEIYLDSFQDIPSGFVFNVEPTANPEGWAEGWNHGATVNYGYSYPEEKAEPFSKAGAAKYGDENQNFIIGWYPKDGEQKPLVLEYQLVGSTEKRYFTFEPASKNSIFECVGYQVNDYTKSLYCDIPLNENESINFDSIVLHNIYRTKNNEAGAAITEPDLSQGYFVSPKQGYLRVYDIKDFIECSFTGLSTFSGFTAIDLNIDISESNVYEHLKANYYKAHLDEINSGKLKIRYRLTSLTLCSFRITFEKDGVDVEQDVKIVTPVTQFKLDKQKGNKVSFLLKDNEVAPGFSAKSIRSVSFVGLYVTLDLMGAKSTIARSNVITRFGYLSVMPYSNNAKLFNVNAFLIILAVSYIVLFIAGAIALYFYLKNKYKNDEFRRMKNKPFFTKCALFLVGSVIVLFDIVFIVLRGSALNNAIVVFNPADAYIIVLSVLSVVIVGYFIKYLVGVIKANKERRRIIKLKLNEDIEDDGTN